MSGPIRVLEGFLLAIVVLGCWLDAVGMLRMREPTQALQYLFLPAVGAIVLAAAVFVEKGNSVTSWKMMLICLMILGVNSIVTHESAQAFRIRELGHWEPRNGDPVEFVRDTESKR